MDFFLTFVSTENKLLVVLFSVLFHLLHGLFFIYFADTFKRTLNVIRLGVVSLFLGEFFVFQWARYVLYFSHLFGFYSDWLLFLLIVDVVVVPPLVLLGFVLFRYSRLYAYVDIDQILFRRNSHNNPI